MTERINLKKARRATRRVVLENPSERNPRDEDGCLYTDPDDPDRHCLAGAVLLELGLRLPREYDGVLDTVDRDRLSLRAAEYLSVLQLHADDIGTTLADMESQYTWAEAYMITEKELTE